MKLERETVIGSVEMKGDSVIEFTIDTKPILTLFTNPGSDDPDMAVALRLMVGWAENVIKTLDMGVEYVDDARPDQLVDAGAAHAQKPGHPVGVAQLFDFHSNSPG